MTQKLQTDCGTFEWEERSQSYVKYLSDGNYGAELKDGRWVPFWVPPDTVAIQFANEHFDRPKQAAERSISYFA